MPVPAGISRRSSTLPSAGSIWWMRRSRYWPTHRLPSAQVRPESPPPPGAGMEPSTRPLAASILSMRCSVICQKWRPSNAAPVAAHTWSPSWVTPWMRVTPSKGPYSCTTSAGRFAAVVFGVVIVDSFVAPGSDAVK